MTCERFRPFDAYDVAVRSFYFPIAIFCSHSVAVRQLLLTAHSSLIALRHAP